MGFATFWQRVFGFRSNGAFVVTLPGATPTMPLPECLPSVVRAIQLLSTDIARLPKMVVDADGNAVESPIGDLLNREASRWQSGYDFTRFLTASALECGNGIAIIRRDGQGEVVELQPCPRGVAQMQMIESGPIYRFTDSTLDSSQVLHIGAFPDLSNPCWYMSPLDAAPYAMQLACEEDAAHLSLVRTGGTGKTSLSHPGAMSDETVQSMREAWKTMHVSADAASRPLILREGMTAAALAKDPVLAMIESRKFSVQEVARAFGVPPEMLYQQGGGALASQVETARAYVDGGLAQWIAAWESEVTRKLLPPGQRLVIDTKPLLRGNLRDQGMALSKLTLAGVMTPNDARDVMDLPAHEEGDELKAMMPGAGGGAMSDTNDGGANA